VPLAGPIAASIHSNNAKPLCQELADFVCAIRSQVATPMLSNHEADIGADLRWRVFSWALKKVRKLVALAKARAAE
jgi:hypothetical protein